MVFVKPLQDIRADEVGEFGGKVANLAVMLQADLPVPGGFAVGVSAFAENGELLPEALSKIQQLLIGNRQYAVRSSALAEDAEDASWAGQFETYLNVDKEDVAAKIVACHGSVKDRAKAYSVDKHAGVFEIAVVVQEMLQPEYAGVLFTQNPVSGQNELVTEYVKGIGETLVSGQADPERVVLDKKPGGLPFDTRQLTELSLRVEKLFGGPQDIEWVWQEKKMWLVQARPITAIGHTAKGYDLGEPDKVFYWGPSRATPKYMGDFMAGIERIFADMQADPALPNPPAALVLFVDGKMVWLSNAKEFSEFVERAFEAYAAQGTLDEDWHSWRTLVDSLPRVSGDAFNKALVEAWYKTELAEFALYGAETAITKRLSRFDDKTMVSIWGAFTTPDVPSFLNELDAELIETQDVDKMAAKYPWIRDGYAGPNDEAAWYFEQRLEAIQKDGLLRTVDNTVLRKELVTKHQLSEEEQDVLAMARKLAEFMDERKAWMMQTRRLIQKPLTAITDGWYFADGQVKLVESQPTRELWQRYIDFKSSGTSLSGTVANSGGKQYVSGEVAVLHSHVDPVEQDKILVVPFTSPGWVPLMRHARAMVTDHGGMMSHAAIVAREFNLPCIVGTGQGTKALKTGDRVVLDMVSGTIIS